MNLIFKLNIAIAILSVIAYFSAYISPQDFWYLGFLAYGIPVFIGLNFIFLLLWIIKGSMRLLVPLFTIILGLGNIKASYSLSPESTPVENQFSVMSYNVNCFNPYPKKSPKDQESFTRITDYLVNENPDILCIQEYCSYPTIKSFDTKSKLLNQAYKDLFYKTRSKSDKFETAGLAIFSKYPFLDRGVVENENKEVIAIYTDLTVSADTIRVYNTHLFSMGLIDNRQTHERRPLKQFIRKLKTGFQAKPAEAAFLKDHILQSPYKVILAGDFNEPPYSYIYKSFNAHFNNSFEIAGNGFGVTYNGKIPFLRIDHQYADKKIRILNHRVLNHMNITDHFPVMVDYTLE